MLVPRVEQVAGAGLDHDGQVELGQPARDRRRAGGEIRGERVEVRVVEGQRDPLVAQIGDHRQRVVQAMVGEPVGAVAKSHVAATFRERRRARGKASATGSAARTDPFLARSAA